MRELANISTFNRLCKSVRNSESDIDREERLRGYDKLLANPGLTGSVKFYRPSDAKTDIGKTISGQQYIQYSLLGFGTYKDYCQQLRHYMEASAEFKNMYANAVLDGHVPHDLQRVRDMIVEFDSSIKNFTNILRSNKAYLGYL